VRKPGSVDALEKLGRERLSPNFFMRDFLYSEIANSHGIPNIPDWPARALEAGRQLCSTLLEPLQERFGRISIRSAYRSPAVNQFGNEHGLRCASNEANYAGHIWDYADAKTGAIGATACVVVNSFVGYYERTGHWQALAWWVHDHLPYSEMEFFPKLAAFNLNWSSEPARSIYSYIGKGRTCLTKPGMENWDGRHDAEYAKWLSAHPSPRP
jgi:hypothetical protein